MDQHAKVVSLDRTARVFSHDFVVDDQRAINGLNREGQHYGARIGRWW